jgi:20S proteasome alpha/beta subunit
VTIAAGFQCSDGVVLCADTEINIPGFVKFPGSKIRLCPRMASRPVFTFAGDVLYCESLIDHIAGRVLLAEQGGEDLRTAVEEEALNMHRTYAGEDYEEGSRLLMSLWLGPDGNRRRQLFEIGSGIAARVLRATAIGTGQSVGRGVIVELFQSDMTVDETALMAVYLLAEAKTYAYGVGKSSQILMLYNDGSHGVFPDDPYHPSIEEMEKDYFQLKRRLRPVILGYCNLAMAPEHFAEALELFKANTIALREKRRMARAEAQAREADREEARAEAESIRQQEEEEEGED